MAKNDIDKFKLVLIGNSGVGKSAIIQRMIYNMFLLNNPSTIGAAYQTLKFDDQIKIDIWDTAGQERFLSLIPMYLKGTDIIFLVLSCESNDIQIKQQLEFWLNFIQIHKAYIKDNFKLFLIFNKYDLNNDFKIPNEFLEDTQFSYIISTSAKTEKNIDNLKLNLEKICKTMASEKTVPNLNNNSQSYSKYINFPDITLPTTQNLKNYYHNSKCSIL